MGSGTFGFKGFKDRALELPAGVTSALSVAVSPSGRARLRYNDVAKQLEQSIDGGAYTPLGGTGAGPWDQVGTDVFPDSTSWNVTIGGSSTTGTEKLLVIGDVRVESSGGIGPGDLYLASDLFFLNQGIPHKIEPQPWPGLGTLGGEIIQISSGPGQDNNTGGSAGSGGRLRLFGGDGGDNTGGNGGGGGPIELTGGDGGDGSAGGSPGGSVDLVGGPGGSTTGATGPAGSGGAVTIQGGTAGVAAGGGFGRPGGSVDIDGGVGSVASGSAAGAGGAIDVDGGIGGAGVAGQVAGAGGAVNIAGGSAGATGGGTGNLGGDVNVDAGPGTGGVADGKVNIGVNNTTEINLAWPSGGATINIGNNTSTINIGRGSSSMGFFGQPAIPQPTVSGASGGNAALIDLVQKLAQLGLIINNIT